MFEEKEGGREGGGGGQAFGGRRRGMDDKIPFSHHPSQARLDMILSCKL